MTLRRFEFLIAEPAGAGRATLDTLNTDARCQTGSLFCGVGPAPSAGPAARPVGGEPCPSRPGSLRVFFDAPDTPENAEFFRAYKEKMKFRFRQIDLWLTTYPIEVV